MEEILNKEVKDTQKELEKVYQKVDNELKNVATNVEKEIEDFKKEVADLENIEKEGEKVATSFLTKLFTCLQPKTK